MYIYPSNDKLVVTEKRVEEEGMREERSPVKPSQAIFKKYFSSVILECKSMLKALNWFAK